MRLLASRLREDDGLARKNAKLLTVLLAEPTKERRHAATVVLAPFFERMVVAFRALQTDAEKHLSRRLRPILGRAANAVIVRRAFCERGAFSEENLARELIERLIISQAGANPVVEA